MRASMRRFCVYTAATLAAGIAVASGNEPPNETSAPPARPVSVSVIEDGDYKPLLDEIAGWLSAEFELPAMSEHPVIRFASNKRMASLRLRDVVAGRSPSEASNIVALYDSAARTIFLPEGWTGATEAETSILVHELTHHLQTLAGQTFDCPEMSEQLPFEAQERWLARRGGSLMTDFGIDPFTLLVRTNCLY